MRERNLGPTRFEGFPPDRVLPDGSAVYPSNAIGPSAADIVDIEVAQAIYFDSLNQVVSGKIDSQSTSGLKPKEISPFLFVERIPRRFRKPLLLFGSLVPLSLAAFICGGGEKNGGGGEIGPEGVKETNGLRLPIADGEQWYLTAGPHYDGLSDDVRYALDFGSKDVVKCPGGAPAENYWAVAVADGKVKVAGGKSGNKNHSVVEVEHEDGLRSGYMHLANIQVKKDQEVKKGDKLGNPSCEYPPGGATDGVHLHAYAKDKNGKALPIEGLELSGWKVAAAETNYNGWLLKNGEEPRTADKRRCGPDNESIKRCEGKRNDLVVGEVLGEATTATPEPEGIVIEATATPRSTNTPEPTHETVSLDRPAWPMYRGDVQHTGRSWLQGPAIPEKLWEFDSEYETLSLAPAVVDSDGKIYMGGFNLSVFNPDGSIEWNFPQGLSHFLDPVKSVALSRGTIYLTVTGSNCNELIQCGPGNGLFAFNPDGTLKGLFDAGGQFNFWDISAPTIDDSDGTIYFTGNGALWVVNPDLSQKWTFQKQGLELISSPAVGGNAIYLSSCDRPKLHAVSLDGYELWEYPIPGSGCSTPAIGPDGTVYVTAGVNLYAVNPDGTEKWEFGFWDAGTFAAPAVAEDGTVYVGGDRLYAVNPDGSSKWVFDGSSVPDFCKGGGACAFVNYSAAVIDADGVIYVHVATTDHQTWLYAINPDGTEKWKIVVDYLPSVSITYVVPPLIGANRVIYAGGYNIQAIGQR